MADKSLAERLKQGSATSRRSSLYVWMSRNFEAFAATLDEIGTPNWAGIVAEFTRDGLTDAAGRPPSPETARQTWYKVRRAREKQKPSGPRLRVDDSAVTVVRAAPAAPEADPGQTVPLGAPSDRPPFQFKRKIGGKHGEG